MRKFIAIRFRGLSSRAVATCLAICCLVVVQQDVRAQPFADPERAQQVYVAVREAIQELDRFMTTGRSDVPGDVLEGLQVAFDAVESGFRATVGHSEDGLDDLCGYLGATGGAVRLDGGGGGVRLDGGGGGVRLDGGGGTVLAARDADWFPGVRSTSPFDLDQAPAASHVIVIDAFNLAAIATAAEAELAASAATASLDSERTPEAGRPWRLVVRDLSLAPGARLVDGRVVVPHGHVVLYHLLGVAAPHVQGLTAYEEPTGRLGPSGPPRLDLYFGSEAAGEFRITLVGITFDELGTIQDAMDFAGRAEFADVPVVASWVLTDCALTERLDDIGEGGTESLASYLLERYEEDDTFGDILTDLCEAFEGFMTEPLDLECDTAVALLASLAMLDVRAAEAFGWPLDPSQEDLRQRVPYDRAYASSGNQSLPFPMPPAAWPGVLGVDACAGADDPTSRAWYANVGDFLPFEHFAAPGGWFGVAVGGARSLGYWGTSFAAPHAALAFGDTDVEWDTWYRIGYCASVGP
jgi:hypothetical protein